MLLDPLSLSIPLETFRPIAPTGPKRKLLRPSPDHVDDYVLEIDNSTLEQFTLCARKSENYAIHGREASKDQSALNFGRLFHQCEELRLRGETGKQLRVHQHNAVLNHFSLYPTAPDDHRTSDRMLQVLRVYNERFAADGWPQNVYLHEGVPFVERPFKVPLCTIEVNGRLPYDWSQLVLVPKGENEGGSFPVRNLHIIWTGRIDLLLNDSNALWVVDHKTTSTGGREFEEAFRLARQTVGYAWAAQQIIGKPMTGCIINAVLIRPNAKTARATLAREEFNRLPYFYSQDRIQEWFEDIKMIVSDFCNCLLRGYFPQSGPRSFKSPCVYCDYHGNCQLPRTQRSADLATDLYRDVTWSPINND